MKKEKTEKENTEKKEYQKPKLVKYDKLSSIIAASAD